MGSTSDLPVIEKAAQLLNDMHVPFEMNALSAHRTPEAVEEFAKNARNRGIKVIIAAAGMAAALPDKVRCYLDEPVPRLFLGRRSYQHIDPCSPFYEPREPPVYYGDFLEPTEI